jgi:hypothetical protein
VTARSLARRALVMALLAGCSTKIVELTPPGDAPVKCNDYLRADGATCHLCFAADGTVTVNQCKPATAMDAATVPPAPPAVCKVAVTGDDRCLACNTTMACLKCDAPTPASGGGYCRVCVWSDNPMQRCLQCYGDDKLRREDTCDGLRKETLLYPPDAGA